MEQLLEKVETVESYQPPEKLNVQETFRQHRTVTEDNYRPHVKDGHDLMHYLENLFKGGKWSIEGDEKKYVNAMKLYKRLNHGDKRVKLPRVYEHIMVQFHEAIMDYSIKDGRTGGTKMKDAKDAIKQRRLENIQKILDLNLGHTKSELDTWTNKKLHGFLLGRTRKANKPKIDTKSDDKVQMYIEQILNTTTAHTREELQNYSALDLSNYLKLLIGSSNPNDIRIDLSPKERSLIVQKKYREKKAKEQREQTIKAIMERRPTWNIKELETWTSKKLTFELKNVIKKDEKAKLAKNIDKMIKAKAEKHELTDPNKLYKDAYRKRKREEKINSYIETILKYDDSQTEEELRKQNMTSLCFRAKKLKNGTNDCTPKPEELSLKHLGGITHDKAFQEQYEAIDRACTFLKISTPPACWFNGCSYELFNYIIKLHGIASTLKASSDSNYMKCKAYEREGVPGTVKADTSATSMEYFLSVIKKSGAKQFHVEY